MNRHLVCLGLGSNLGDRADILKWAIHDLNKLERIVVERVSSFHETKPIGGPIGQGPFLNAAATLRTTLHPFEVFSACQNIEKDLGRVRETHWGPRTIDIDLLLFGDQILEGRELLIPHPLMKIRRFVLAPLAEIASEVVEPVGGQTMAKLLADLDRRPTLVRLSEVWPDSIREYAMDQLQRELGAIVLRAEEDIQAEEVHKADWLVCDWWSEGLSDQLRKTFDPTFQPTFAAGPNDFTDQMGSQVTVVRIAEEDPEMIVREILAICAGTRS